MVAGTKRVNKAPRDSGKKGRGFGLSLGGLFTWGQSGTALQRLGRGVVGGGKALDRCPWVRG